MVELIINEEFKNLIPRLEEAEYNELERDILERGILDPILIWNNTIIDGHHRYEIAKKHGLDFKVLEIQGLKNEREVRKWMFRHQSARRNINSFTRAEIAIKYMNEMKDEGEGEEVRNCEESVCKIFGIERDILYRVDTILKYGDEKIINEARNKEKSIYDAFVKVSRKRQKDTRKLLKVNAADVRGHYYFGNCFQYMKTEGTRNSVDIVITEPPQPSDNEIIKRFPQNGPMRLGYSLSIMEKITDALANFIKPNSYLFIVVNPDYIVEYTTVIKKHFKIKQYIAWDFTRIYDNSDPKRLSKRYKIIIFAYRGADKLLTEMGSDFLKEDVINESYKFGKYDTLPEPLITKLIKFTESADSVVFDPFAGYGSVVRAALDMQVSAIGCEYNKDVFDKGYELLKEAREEVKK